MSQIGSSSKDHQWKRIINRKNQIESAFESTVSRRKFTPIKDSSLSNSRVFQKSREREKSRSSIKGLNQSRVRQDTGRQLQSQRSESKLKDSIEKQHYSEQSLLNSVNQTNDAIKIGDIQTSILKGQNVGASNTNMKQVQELQKQFRSFKDKVLKQLQRQEQFLQQMVRQIIVTVEYEMSKLLPQLNKNSINDNSKSKILNKQHEKFSALKSKVLNLEPKECSRQSPNTLRSVKSEKNLLEKRHLPPVLNSRDLKFDRFFELINKLKGDFMQMHEFDSGPQEISINSPSQNKGSLFNRY